MKNEKHLLENSKNILPPIYSLRYLLEVFVIAFIYYVSGRIGQFMAIDPGNVTPVWPASGIALAAILLRGYRVWPGIWLGSLIVNSWAFFDSTSTHSIVVSITTGSAIGIGASLEAVLGTFLIHRYAGLQNPLDRAQDTIKLMIYGGPLSCLVSATFGVTSLSVGTFLPWANYGVTWWTWWLGDTVGVLALTPILLVWIIKPRQPLQANEIVKWLIALVLLAIVSIITFGDWLFIDEKHVSIAFVTIPFIVWMAYKFGQRGATMGIVVLSTIAIIFTLNDCGPFALQSLNKSLLLLQAFIGIVITTSLLLAAVVAERKKAEQNIKLINESLEYRIAEHTKELKEKNLTLNKDIAERKNMEHALLQSEKLKSIGTITAGISHEFNNLLAIISGNVQLLEEDYKDDKVLTGILRTIMKAADDGAEISNNMLKFTKTESDTKEYVSFDIRNLIGHSIDFTKPRWKNEAQARGIGYTINTKDMKNVPFMMCKPAEIREIFINIINNALDAMPDGGSITFSTWSKDDTVFVSVSDSGVGMPENVKENIFDPFFSTKGVEGTGLGMSMVYGIVTRHGGKIDVVSEIGNGTIITLQFQTTNKRASLIETPEPEQEANKEHLRILVVDDEEAMGNILDQFLSRDGHTVKTVDNGADAINMVKDEKFDLVLCDLAMPNVYGYDVVKALNGLKNRPKIGIISGWCQEPVPVDKEIKVDFYLKKPFKHSELAKHINELFGADSK